MKQSGFTLPEMLIAMAVGSVLMLSAARFLPLLQRQNLQSLMQLQLYEELRLIVTTLEKTVRRAGYCHGECSGEGLEIDAEGACLLVRWDENSNGKWEEVGDSSERYGYRLRGGNLETQRGVSHCDSSGWEKLNDPSRILISDFRVVKVGRQIRLLLSGRAVVHPGFPLTLESWITAENL